MTLEGDTLIQMKKWRNAICSAFCQNMSTKKISSSYKKLKSESKDITKFLFPLDTHYKYATAKGEFEAFSRALRVHIVKDTTISSSKEPKSHVKIVTYMNYDNGFKLLISVVFAMSHQLGVLGPKSQDLMIPFCLGEGKPLPYFHLRALITRNLLVLMRD